MRCDSVVVGAGITGALMAEHLSSLGQRVCIIDRERPGYGSTAASTAMLLWEIDSSLSELTALYGFERAADVYRRSFRAVAGLQSSVLALGLDCTLYIAGGATDETEILAECALRRRAGLPGQYLDYRALQREFGMARRCAIVSPGAADADPLLRCRSGVLRMRRPQRERGSGDRLRAAGIHPGHSAQSIVELGTRHGSTAGRAAVARRGPDLGSIRQLSLCPNHR
jgi:glycine/D-amino acid oxidase-like deaminating enzyme